MMRRNGWRPGKWTCGDQKVIIGAVYAAAWVRVFDYATGDRSSTLRVAEAIMPLHWWAIVLGSGCLVLADGWMARRHLTVTVGHAILGFGYLALALGTLFAYLLPLAHDVIDGRAGVQSIDGIRNAGPILAVALIHLITALRTGVEPLPHDDEQLVEATAAATSGGADG